eukprot:TRINITY_DN77442_c0_g1_i1.p1 TRINITY_DN77442_c0_g1~~TRINITY_DN77442_c0_g1_i1.p1  ORF type:complete len:1172 (-),score=167.32 TRINITY_DN77442_c0_g1_i1:214-3729(-)
MFYAWLVLLWLNVHVCIPSKVIIPIKVFLPFCHDGPCSWKRGQSLQIATEMMKDALNAAEFLGESHQLRLDYADMACSVDNAPTKVVEMINSGIRYFGIIGPACSGDAAVLVPLVQMLPLPVVSGSASQPSLGDRRLYPNFWRTVTPINSFAAVMTIFRAMGWNRIGVACGNLNNFEAIWEDTKYVARSSGMQFQVSFGSSRHGEEIHEDEEFAFVLDAESAMQVAQRLHQKRLRVTIAVLYAAEARLLLCSQILVGMQNVVLVTYGWFSTDWFSQDVEIEGHGNCTREEMARQADRSILLNHMDWNTKPATLLGDCAMPAQTAGNFRALYEAAAEEAALPITTEAGTFADAVCMYGRALRELLINRKRSASQLLSRDPAVWQEVVNVLDNTSFDGPGGLQEFGLSKVDRTQNGAGDRRGPMILQQLVSGKRVDCKALNYPYTSDDIVELGSEFTFLDDEGKVSNTTPPGLLLPWCGSIYDTSIYSSCLECKEGSTFDRDVEACVCSPGWVQIPGECSRCPAGRFNIRDDRTTNTCYKCAPGTWSASGSGTCSPCSPGEYSEDVGAEDCSLCDYFLYRVDHSSTLCKLDAFLILCRLLASLFLASAFEKVLFAFRIDKMSNGCRAFSVKHFTVNDIHTAGGKTVLTTLRHHCLRNWHRQSFRIILTQTGHHLLDDVGCCFRARVLGPKRLEILDRHGKACDGVFESSKGFVRLTARGTFWHYWPSLMPGPLAILVPSHLASGVALTTYDLRSVWELCAVVVCSFAIMVVLYRNEVRSAANSTQLMDLVTKYEKSVLCLDERGPTRTEPGHDRAIHIGKLICMFEHFQSIILDRNMYYVEPNIVRTLTSAKKLSFAELLGPSRVQWFVSHYWGVEFQSTLGALRKHATFLSDREVPPSPWTLKAYWICTFSNNQHKLHEEIPGDLDECSFFKTLYSSHCEGVCLVLDDEATALTRSWCLFEFLHTVELAQDKKKQSFGGLVFCHSSGVLDYGTASVDVSTGISQRLLNLDLREATASRPEDKAMIDGLVVAKMQSFDEINLRLKKEILEAVVEAKVHYNEAFDRLIEKVKESEKTSPSLRRLAARSSSVIALPPLETLEENQRSSSGAQLLAARQPAALCTAATNSLGVENFESCPDKPNLSLQSRVQLFAPLEAVNSVHSEQPRQSMIFNL